jgi:hypothetical protein
MISFHLLVRISDREKVLGSLMETSGRKLETLTESESFLPWKL